MLYAQLLSIASPNAMFCPKAKVVSSLQLFPSSPSPQLPCSAAVLLQLRSDDTLVITTCDVQQRRGKASVSCVLQFCKHSDTTDSRLTYLRLKPHSIHIEQKTVLVLCSSLPNAVLSLNNQALLNAMHKIDTPNRRNMMPKLAVRVLACPDARARFDACTRSERGIVAAVDATARCIWLWDSDTSRKHRISAPFECISVRKQRDEEVSSEDDDGTSNECCLAFRENDASSLAVSFGSTVLLLSRDKACSEYCDTCRCFGHLDAECRDSQFAGAQSCRTNWSIVWHTQLATQAVRAIQCASSVHTMCVEGSLFSLSASSGNIEGLSQTETESCVTSCAFSNELVLCSFDNGCFNALHRGHCVASCQLAEGSVVGVSFLSLAHFLALCDEQFFRVLRTGTQRKLPIRNMAKIVSALHVAQDTAGSNTDGRTEETHSALQAARRFSSSESVKEVIREIELEEPPQQVKAPTSRVTRFGNLKSLQKHAPVVPSVETKAAAGEIDIVGDKFDPYLHGKNPRYRHVESALSKAENVAREQRQLEDSSGHDRDFLARWLPVAE
ncbi:MAG: hypothetical protein MHM6MM_003050 [Cercozoa sp. M6MM]